MKPTVVISACLDGYPYRYNGGTVNDDNVNRIKKLFNIIHVCPEFEIGLGVPRDTIRLFKVGDKIKAIQDNTGVDLTDALSEFAERFVLKLDKVHGFIMKAKSPSCGFGTTKLFINDNPSGKTSGIFTAKVKELLDYVPIIDEGRMKNPELMWEFLTKVFMLFRFESAKENIAKLVDFHSRNKYLFMSISQTDLKRLGKIIAGHKKGNFQEVVESYEREFKNILKKTFRKSNIINSLLHMFGYVSKKLTGKEKKHFLNLLEKYKKGAVTLDVPIAVLKSYGMRFEDEYLLSQYFLEPFPEL